MRQKMLIAISLFVFLLSLGNAVLQAQTYNESGGIVVIEMENGSSPLGGWAKKSSPALNGFSGTSYLEATSNSYISGSAKSPREYSFKINSGGLYMLQLRCAKETIDGRTDVANDCFVKMEGDFTAGPNAGNSHGKDAPLSLLQQNTKLYGGSADKFSWSGKNNSLDPGGHNNKRNARYEFKSGKTYKLTISERSGKFKIDRILLRKTSVKDSAAYNAPESEAVNTPNNNVQITGELRKWHKVTLTFTGPNKNETSNDNPFLNYRLNVTFTKGNKSYKVPGYFAADGNAGETGATSGNKWRVHFAPPETGTWNWSASFRKGNNIAVNLNDNAGSATSFNGASGTISINNTNKSGRDLRGKGLLEYVGEHYPRFAETGEYFVKQGPDAPENLLAYQDFDGPFKSDGKDDSRIKNWQPHVGDWNNGDPTWKNGKGKGLVGVINYLASEGMNAVSFLTMNIAGDDKNVFPYTNYNERRRMDVSRLDQWEVVFEHGTKQGFFLHFKTQETENDDLLDGGVPKSGKGTKSPGAPFGLERKLYYRELVARFSHHLALNWNLGEEWDAFSPDAIKDYSDYFEAIDPYGHAVVLHTYPGQQNQRYNPLLGHNTFDGTSIQTSNQDFRNVHNDVARWVKNSRNAGRKWLVACDEPGDASWAIRQDNDKANSYEDGRKNALWGTFCGGGWGNEWYFGYKNSHSDLTLEDFRTRNQWWDYCRYALQFWSGHNLPLADMVNDNNKSDASNDYCYFKNGDTYVVYLKNGGTTRLDLRNISGNFSIKWFDPRNGGNLKDGSVKNVSGGAWRGLGQAPNNTGKDWAILIRNGSTPPPPPPPPPGMKVTRFNLMNGSTVVRELKQGDEILIGEFDNGTTYHIEALVEGEVESVIFDVNGAGKTENLPPYDFNPFTPAIGDFTVLATPFSADKGGGVAGTSKTVTFSIIDVTNRAPIAVNDNYATNQGQKLTVNAPGIMANDSDPDGDTIEAIKVSNPSKGSVTVNSGGKIVYTPNAGYTGTDSFTYLVTDGFAESNVATVTITVNKVAPALKVTKFTLVNADTDQDIRELTGGDVINQQTDGTNFNIRADIEGAVESVVFTLNGSVFQTENLPVYAMAGNTGNDYKVWTPALGQYTLTATPYSQDKAGGTEGQSKTINFTVVAEEEVDPFVAGINLNGPAITIDGQDWMSMAEAQQNGLTLGKHNKGTTNVSPINGGGAGQMLKNFVYITNDNLTLSYPVENGQYEVTLYSMQWKSTLESKFDVILEGATKATAVGFNRNDQLGLWKKSGPYTVTVSDQRLNLTLGSFVMQHGDADPQLMGLSIQKK